MYYGTRDIILLDIVIMDKEGFAFCFATSLIFVVEEEGEDGNHACNHLTTLKHVEELEYWTYLSI